MNGCIVSQNLNKSNILNMIKNTISMEGNNLVNEVTTDKPYQYMKLERIYKSYIDLNINATKPNSQKLTNIILIDLGVKQNIIERLLSYGCQINVVPATTTPQIIASYKPDGIVLSNGPGDPEPYDTGRWRNLETVPVQDILLEMLANKEFNSKQANQFAEICMRKYVPPAMMELLETYL